MAGGLTHLDLWWHPSHDAHSPSLFMGFYIGALCVKGTHIPTVNYIMTEGCKQSKWSLHGPNTRDTTLSIFEVFLL